MNGGVNLDAKAAINGYQAVLFYGASPGVGKSTLSSFLFEQLSSHNLPVKWVYEDDVLALPHFAEFIADIFSGNPKMMASLLDATRALVQECINRKMVLITDSIYPCINWLIATKLYSHQELVAFGVELEQLLAPLHPLAVYLDADPKFALQRAIDQRGDAWFQELLAALNSYAINREQPLQTLDEMADYFRIQAALSLVVLQQWSSDLLLMDAIQTPLDRAKIMLLEQLDLDEIARPLLMAADDLDSYVGVYQAEASVSMTNPLVITRAMDKLHVNTYWPTGCPLLAEGDGGYRLENTSHRIQFERLPDGLVAALTYTSGAKAVRFEKV